MDQQIRYIRSMLMNNMLQANIDNFVNNTMTCEGVFTLDSNTYSCLGALLCLPDGERLERAALKKCKKLLHANTGLFSNLRGRSRILLVAALSRSKDPEWLLSRIQRAYTELRKEFARSEHLPFAAFLLAEYCRPDQYFFYVMRAKSLFLELKGYHSLLTQNNFVPLCVLMSFSDRNTHHMASETEKCYKLLKNSFFGSSSILLMSCILAMYQGSPEKKTGAVLNMQSHLHAKALPFGSTTQIPALASLSMCLEPQEALSQNVSEAYIYLKKEKHFGFFLTRKSLCLLFASVLVNNSNDNSALLCPLQIGTTAPVSQLISILAIVCCPTLKERRILGKNFAKEEYAS